MLFMLSYLKLSSFVLRLPRSRSCLTRWKGENLWIFPFFYYITSHLFPISFSLPRSIGPASINVCPREKAIHHSISSVFFSSCLCAVFGMAFHSRTSIYLCNVLASIWYHFVFIFKLNCTYITAEKKGIK